MRGNWVEVSAECCNFVRGDVDRHVQWSKNACLFHMPYLVLVEMRTFRQGCAGHQDVISDSHRTGPVVGGHYKLARESAHVVVNVRALGRKQSVGVPTCSRK